MRHLTDGFRPVKTGMCLSFFFGEDISSVLGFSKAHSIFFFALGTNHLSPFLAFSMLWMVLLWERRGESSSL